VSHVITTIERGGAENQLLMLTKGQVQFGYSVSVYPLKGELELKDEFEKHGVKIVKTLYQTRFVRQILKIKKISQSQNSIIHAHLPQAELVVSASGIRNYFVSRHFGGQFFPGRNAYLSRWLSKFAIRNAASVIAISHSVAQYLLDNHELLKSTVLKVVPYGFDKENFLINSKSATKSEMAPIGQRRFGTVARLSEEKDLPTLIKAFYLHQLNSQFAGNQLEIYGAGPLEFSLRQLIAELSLQDSVRLMGRTQNPEQTINSFDVFVLTSKFEGFGMVLLEAMSLGLPIICSRIDTALEVMGNSGAAIFFEPENEKDLELKMRGLDDLLPLDFRERQQVRLNRYSIYNSVTQLHETYQKLLATHS